MTKSWKKLVKATDSNSNNTSENSLSTIQSTLNEIAAQNEELDHLLKERQSLEKEMGNLIQSNNPVAEDPRFSGTIESLSSKREKEKVPRESDTSPYKRTIGYGRILQIPI